MSVKQSGGAYPKLVMIALPSGRPNIVRPGLAPAVSNDNDEGSDDEESSGGEEANHAKEYVAIESSEEEAEAKDSVFIEGQKGQATVSISYTTSTLASCAEQCCSNSTRPSWLRPKGQ